MSKRRHGLGNCGCKTYATQTAPVSQGLPPANAPITSNRTMPSMGLDSGGMGATLYQMMFPASNNGFGEGGQVRCASNRTMPNMGPVSPISYDGYGLPITPSSPDRGTPTMYPGRLFKRISAQNLDPNFMWDDMWAGGDTRSGTWHDGGGGGETSSYTTGNPVQSRWSANRLPTANLPANQVGNANQIGQALQRSASQRICSPVSQQNAPDLLNPSASPSVSTADENTSTSLTPSMTSSDLFQQTGAQVSEIDYDSAVASASIAPASAIQPLMSPLSAPIASPLTSGTVIASAGNVGLESSSASVAVPTAEAQQAAVEALAATNVPLAVIPVASATLSPMLSGGAILIFAVLAFSISWDK